ncbi:MAG: glycosyltransferase family 2 protein [Gammaproteobacteria bacterium]|nr:glycosyltransferase family 2 protein [Gammaproteobacteria bacterium]
MEKESGHTLGRISVVIITKDAELHLANVLESTASFGEVIIYDNGSTDSTIDIARGFPNVEIATGKFLGYGPTKNHAVSLANNDWVLTIDSDEAVSEQLLYSLSNLDLGDPNKAYRIRLDNYFMGKKIKYCGWGSNWPIRFYNRTVHSFTDAMVHERVVEVKHSRECKLDGALIHYAVTDIGQFLVKINRYSEIRKETWDRAYPVFVIVLRSLWALFRTYVLRLGFLDGWRGLVIAVSEANGVFYKYMKVYAKHKA